MTNYLRARIIGGTAESVLQKGATVNVNFRNSGQGNSFPYDHYSIVDIHPFGVLLQKWILEQVLLPTAPGVIRERHPMGVAFFPWLEIRSIEAVTFDEEGEQ